MDCPLHTFQEGMESLHCVGDEGIKWLSGLELAL